MKFIFRRKYTLPFLLLLALLALCAAFYYFGPDYINQDKNFFNDVLIISSLISILVVLFVTGLSRVHYFLYHDHMEIRRSLLKPILLDYNQIKEVKEVRNDRTFLIFGKRPSFKVKYETRGKIKNYRIRIHSHELFKTVLENEKKIRIVTHA